MSETRDEQWTRDPIKLGLIFGGLVTVLWVATPFLTRWQYSDPAMRGQFGDLFGSINALFSGLAFVGVIVAILLQKQELGLQRQELRDTRQEMQYSREEMKRTADAQEAAKEALNKTIWAQSWKVAHDLLEDPQVIGCRNNILANRERLESGRGLWGGQFTGTVNAVGRSYDAVGTMIRKGLLPEHYIIESYSVPIARYWGLLERFVEEMRKDENDPFIWQDFEALAAAASAYLIDHDPRREKL